MKEYKTDNYLIQVDQEKNLIMIRPFGFWDTTADISTYLPTIRKALDEDLKDNFMVICDLSQMKSATKKVRDEIHAQAGLEVLKRKVLATVLVSPESAITRMQIEYLRKTYINKPLKVVDTLEGAYDFLKKYQ